VVKNQHCELFLRWNLVILTNSGHIAVQKFYENNIACHIFHIGWQYENAAAAAASGKGFACVVTRK
jgi:hypothetical protein